MLKTLALINFALAAFDCWLTRRRMNQYGIWVELNKTIQTLSKYLGIETGVMLGIMIPVLAQTAVFYWLNWPIAFALLIGFRFKLFIVQLHSIQLEKKLTEQQKQIIHELGTRSSSYPRTPPPMRDTSLPNKETDDTMGPSNLITKPPEKGPQDE